MAIKDGTGKGNLAKVTSDNRLLVDSINELVSSERSRSGQLFGVGTGYLTTSGSMNLGDSKSAVERSKERVEKKKAADEKRAKANKKRAQERAKEKLKSEEARQMRENVAEILKAIKSMSAN